VVDAVVSGTELTLELCSELRRLAPFGLGNPGVTLLLPSCELRELATVGDGKHLRFRVLGRDNDSGSAIAFGLGTQLDRFRREGRYDVVFRLEENHWNGTVAPQLVVRRVFDAHEGYESLREWLAAQWRLPEPERTPEARAVFAELALSGETRGRRPLLESEAFRALLNEPVLARAA
jgi:RecJ OB domain